MWELDSKKSWVLKNWCFWTVMLEKTLERPLDFKIKPVNPKGNQSWIFIGRTDAEAEAPIVWPPDAKNWLTGKDPDAGNDWRLEKGTTEDEMVGWHHWLDGYEFEPPPGAGNKQGSLACYSPWGHKESDMTEQLNWSKEIKTVLCMKVLREWYEKQHNGRKYFQTMYLIKELYLDYIKKYRWQTSQWQCNNISYYVHNEIPSDTSSVQFSSVAQLCPTLCDPMDCSTPGFPVHHQLPELAQTHVHWVGDAIQASHPLSSPSPPAFNLSQH